MRGKLTEADFFLWWSLLFVFQNLSQEPKVHGSRCFSILWYEDRKRNSTALSPSASRWLMLRLFGEGKYSPINRVNGTDRSSLWPLVSLPSGWTPPLAVYLLSKGSHAVLQGPYGPWESAHQASPSIPELCKDLGFWSRASSQTVISRNHCFWIFPSYHHINFLSLLPKIYNQEKKQHKLNELHPRSDIFIDAEYFTAHPSRWVLPVNPCVNPSQWRLSTQEGSLEPSRETVHESPKL